MKQKLDKNKVTKTNKKNLKSKRKAKKNNIKIRRIGAIICLIIIVAILFTLIIFSNLFSIKKIIVENNLKISEYKVIEDSQLIIGDNLFKTLNKTIKSRIKKEPYIENVNIKKKLNGEIIITIYEREATYMIKIENEYAYINNQGYILERSETPLELPIINGFKTEEIVPGSRLIESDLQKLDVLIQIMESAKYNGIEDKIYSINVSDKNNFILEIPSESKTVQFGDNSNISVKMLWIVDLLERTKGISGEIVLNVENIKKVYFREQV